MRKFVIQFNESNFDIIKKYSNKYDLPNFKKLLNSNTFASTESENKYEYLEPWIQWYSFYTGMPYEDHNVFHLGDCLKNEHENFVQKYAVNNRVGIFGAMNLPPHDDYIVYIPDAWTESIPDETLSSRLVSKAVSRLVNSNAGLKIRLSDVLGLLILIGYPKSIKDIKILFKVVYSFFTKSRHHLAAYFDYYFLKYSLKRAKREHIDLSLVFLNGFAHVQHHYMFNSEFSNTKNPPWYAKEDQDYLLEALRIYDLCFEMMFEAVEDTHEYFVLTGLTQEPYKDPFIYWRFKDHQRIFSYFFNKNIKILPRMTRDFEIFVDDNESFEKLLSFLTNAKVKYDGQVKNAFGHIDKTSNKSIFASFVYSGECDDIFLEYGEAALSLKNQLDFIAIKNAGHDQRGWLISNKICKSDEYKIWEAGKAIV